MNIVAAKPPSGLRSSDTHFVTDPSSALNCRAENFFAALRYRRDARSALSQNFRADRCNPAPLFCGQCNAPRAACVWPLRGRLNLRGAAFEPLSGGADRNAHVLSQAEIDAVPNERCLPD